MQPSNLSMKNIPRNLDLDQLFIFNLEHFADGVFYICVIRFSHSAIFSH